MKCPTHKQELERRDDAPVFGGVLLVCPERGCEYSRMPERQRTELKLPGLDPGKQSRRVAIREEDLQRSIILALRAKGFEVLQTTVRYRFSPCVHCGGKTRPAGGYGADRGVPDLIVWVPPGWKGIEVKGSETAVSDEQKRLEAEGKIVIVRSVAEALAAVEA